MTQIGITPKETEPYPVLESNSKNKCFGKEWPKLALLRRRHLQPARQDSQPDTRPNTSTARLVRKNNARAKNFLFGIASKARELYLFLKSNSNKECFGKKSLNWNYFQVAHESHSWNRTVSWTARNRTAEEPTPHEPLWGSFLLFWNQTNPNEPRDPCKMIDWHRSWISWYRSSCNLLCKTPRCIRPMQFSSILSSENMPKRFPACNNNGIANMTSHVEQFYDRNDEQMYMGLILNWSYTCVYIYIWLIMYIKDMLAL